MILVGFLAGWLGWTLAEYLLHRFDMHGRRGAMAHEHRLHHAGRPLVPDRSPRGWVGAALLAAVLAWGTQPAVGAGWLVGHAAYDLRHWAIHARPPRGRYGRWVRAHHLHHHVVAPDRNYAVTLPLWDHVFRTHARPAAEPASPARPVDGP
ncbi:MAG TPA: sterol desaturase family protein [Acidimicrobiales bacterium]